MQGVYLCSAPRDCGIHRASYLFDGASGHRELKAATTDDTASVWSGRVAVNVDWQHWFIEGDNGDKLDDGGHAVGAAQPDEFSGHGWSSSCCATRLGVSGLRAPLCWLPCTILLAATGEDAGNLGSHVAWSTGRGRKALTGHSWEQWRRGRHLQSDLAALSEEPPGQATKWSPNRCTEILMIRSCSRHFWVFSSHHLHAWDTEWWMWMASAIHAWFRPICRTPHATGLFRSWTLQGGCAWPKVWSLPSPFWASWIWCMRCEAWQLPGQWGWDSFYHRLRFNFPVWRGSSHELWTLQATRHHCVHCMGRVFPGEGILWSVLVEPRGFPRHPSCHPPAHRRWHDSEWAKRLAMPLGMFEQAYMIRRGGALSRMMWPTDSL